ncbi:putative fibrinogen-like protein A-like [Apostichopus japonicus]|uniref:Putative fibrinogen-like protein A-like n=1 Tax=Stichopus japonicus TaxID=307972 RepID=A0A2G8LHH6_STIJA|nr:putative fibrinogen-like protein A-like [Apostichopus japonicus]
MTQVVVTIDIVNTKASSFFFYQRAEYPRDCHEVLSQCPSSINDGVYVIKPDGYPEPFEVYCNNSLGDGGWTVIQRREDSSINFNRSWDEYENGFGFLSHEFWLGNEKISYITNQRKYQLRMDITTESGCSFFVTYELSASVTASVITNWLAPESIPEQQVGY